MLRKSMPRVAVAVLMLGSAVLVVGAPVSSPVVPDAAYVQSFEKWKAEQIDDLKQNWLPLAGLFWLKPGVNRFGTAPGNAVVFPKGAAHAGEIDLDGKDVTIKLLPSAHATLAGAPLTKAKLDPDVSGHASLVEMGTLRFHVIVRGERVGIRVKDLESASVANFKGLIFYPLGAGCGDSHVQDQRPGAEADCAGRRSSERTVVCVQRSDGQERYLSRRAFSR